MGIRLRVLVAMTCMVLAAPMQAATPEIVFKHGEVAPGSAAGVLQVRSGTLHMALAPDVVLSASSGAEFRVGTEAGQREILIVSGVVRLVHTGANSLVELGPGRYVFDPRGLALRASPAADERGVHGLDDRPGAVLSDRIMAMQKEALKFDTRDFIRGLFSFVRGGRDR
jgi:hypothetical protein